jgi:putative ABC transport system substrate-binding protein
MKRREFITLVGGAAAAWPLAARAQQPRKLPTIGFLGPNTASAWRPWTAAFVQRLHELGWIEGRSLAIEYRWADARSERFAEIAAEFVRLKVDVIVTGGSAAVAAKQADCEPANRAYATTTRRYCRACPRSWLQSLLLTKRPEHKCSC